MSATVIPFPVERRRRDIETTVESVPMTVIEANAVVGFGGMVMTVAGGSVVFPTLPFTGCESWWGRVPPVDQAPLWAKMGLSPAPTTKRHRLIAVVTEEEAGVLRLVALAACGRRGPLSFRFDEAISGGDCSHCQHAL